ncbi:NAD(P)H-binding protein [Thalassotalea piscium]
MLDNKGVTKSVAIIGCGWLGQALAQFLLAHQYSVIGTSQSQERLNLISSLGATPECLRLPINDNDECQYQCFNCHSLVIAIPPQFRSGNINYPENIAQIVSHAKKGQVKQIILINSTAIYGGLVGKVDENAVLNLSQEKVTLLQQAESYVLNSGLSAVSLRVAGLVGPNRSPRNFFKQGRVLKDPDAFSNLVHQYDVVQCIAGMIETPENTGIYNLASKMRMSKQAFYQHAGLMIAESALQTDCGPSLSTSKLVISDKIRQALSIKFEYDDLLAWLNVTR